MDNPAKPDVRHQFSDRELEILRLTAVGLSNQEIADRLFLAVTTIKWYIRQINDKLDTHSRTQMVSRAHQLKLITENEPGMYQATGDSLPNVSSTLVNPYKGLRAFQENDAPDFFGREMLTAQILARLNERTSPTRFLAVVGPSGSGKSSVVNAGLIPALRSGKLSGSGKWWVASMFPGAYPLEELEAALLRLAVNPPESLIRQLREDDLGLLRTVKRVLPADETVELVLVIDQFEEIFTLVEKEESRSHFLQSLYAALTDPRSRIWVIITLRADFLDRPLLYPNFGALLRQRLELVVPLTSDELREAIIAPAEHVGVEVQAELVSEMIHDVQKQPGTLPLLQYALTELFEQSRGRRLTLETYRASGGVLGALARRADTLYRELDPTGQESARQIFLRLVALGEGVEDTRRRVPRAELLAMALSPTDRDDLPVLDEIVDAFGQHRLLTLDRDPVNGAPTVEIAHEALLREWKLLRVWLNESRVDMRQQRALAAAAQEWQNGGRDSSFLLSGSRLGQFEEWAASTGLALTTDERAYLAASLAERESQTHTENERRVREIRLERRSRTFLRVLVVVLFMAALGAFGLTGVAVNQSSIARQNEAEAQSLALASQAQLALNEGSIDQAIALAKASLEIRDNALAQRVLDQADFIPGTRRIFQSAANIGGGILSTSETPLKFVMIAHVGPEFGPFAQVMIKGMTDACDVLKASCQWLSPPFGITDPTEMRGFWDQALEMNPDGIGTTIIVPDDIRSGVATAAERGIPVVAFNVADAQDTDPSLPALLYVGSDEFVSGVTSARRVFAQARTDGIKIVHGACTNQNAYATALIAYCRGVKTVFDEENVPLDILPISDESWDLAAEQITAYFAEHPETNTIFVTGPGPTESFHIFLQKAGLKPGQLYATTRDTSPLILQLIQDGYLLQAIDQQPYMQGFQTIISLYLYRQYGLRPSGYINTSSVIDRNNVERVTQLVEAGYR